MRDKSPYWFPAKRYGYGWSLPTVWQGWAVLFAFFALSFAGALWLLPAHQELLYLGFVLLLCAVLVVLCWLKGEPARWRWGRR